MKITIKKNRRGSFNVHALGKFADGINYDEMLGLISSLTMPERKPCMGYLQTKEERKYWEEKFKKPKETKQPLLLDKDYWNLTSTSVFRHSLIYYNKLDLNCQCGSWKYVWNPKHQQLECLYCHKITNFPLGFMIQYRMKHNLPSKPELKAGFTRLVENKKRIQHLVKTKALLLVTDWGENGTISSSLFVACLNPATLSKLLENKQIFEFNSL